VDTTKKETPQIDPLRRVFVPREREREDGTHIFRTTDGSRYIRGVSGAIRREEPKMNGKEARKIRRMLRQNKRHA
jgi:hypothetical protein